MEIETRIPLTTSNNANTERGKTIEETYQKKTQLEHILLRPDTYVGSIEKHTQNLWVFDEEEKRMVNRSITYVPGLYKIFDEILVNAADNKQRDSKMDSLKVVIDVEQNLISVFNNGDGVPVEIHKEEGVYVPELIFGHLLTSSNYDDDVKKTTGGRNGYGAKLTNIFSTEFVVETADGYRQKKYKQVFSENMGKKSNPIFVKCKDGENWTKVSFKPDLQKFSMTHLEDDVVALMKKRVVDMAGCLGKTVKVELNGNRVPVKSFQDYVKLYLDSVSGSTEEKPPCFYEKVGERWEVCVSLTEGQFQQVSFVNSIATTKGGTHVDYVTNQVATYVMGVVNKKKKNANIKAHNVKNYLWVFVNALIDNPAFDSQTKETLTLRQSSFGSKCELSEEFLKKVAKSDIVNSLLSWADFKESKELKKTDGAKISKINVPKLEDANEAGGRKSENCTLILTEGDSAKTMAVSGISGLPMEDRDFYGVFPLRGKLLNVREATTKQINENKEIQSIKKILGLQQGKNYDNVKSLRYGHLMIMTDQDHDGSHIKGLLINFIHSFWPSLLKVPSFLVQFSTPILKATHKNGTKLSFYSIPEYEEWRNSPAGSKSGWSIKYYKGLGTSEPGEGKEYFKELEKHKKFFVWEGEQDANAIELAFSKKKIEARKDWLRQFEPGTYLDPKEKLVKYSDFVNKELILFSVMDLQRSIPSLVDGLKPGQRKILHYFLKYKCTKSEKLGNLSGMVSAKTAYHHGEQSLVTTMIGMAQNFVGANNINLLYPEGQFGSRLQGGKDHASARYISTFLCPISRYLFHKDDDGLLNYLLEDGKSIEPSWYIPVIPMILVNGCEGIGTGWSTYIPNYNPRDLIKNIRLLLNGDTMEPMHPWYRGFKGSIEKGASKESGVSYVVSGLIEQVNETTLRITELPLRVWTDDYKKILISATEGMKDENNNLFKDTYIKIFKSYNDENTVEFEISLLEEKVDMIKQEGLLKKFKLTSTISTSNMHLFDSNGMIKKYDTPEQILEEFFHLRIEFYEKRRNALIENLEKETQIMENKVRFILGVVSGEIIVSNRKRADLLLELHQKKFKPFPKSKSGQDAIDGETNDTEDTEDNIGNGVRASDYEYLLSMPIGSLTLEKVQKLRDDRDKICQELDYYINATIKELWETDLCTLEKELDELDRCDAEIEEQRQKCKNGAGKVSSMVSRQATKVPRKRNTKEKSAGATEGSMGTSSSSAVETGNAPEAVKPKGKAGPKKAAAKKNQVQQTPVLHDMDNDDDDEVAALKDRLKAYTLNDTSPEQSAAMDTDDPQEPINNKKGTSKRGPGQKKATVVSDSEEEVDQDDDDFDVEVVAAPKKGGRKATGNAKAAKPPAAARKKRGPANGKQQQPGQKLLTEMLQPTENSPDKKVRKMRASPFNKKSGSVLGRINDKEDEELTGSEELSGGSASASNVEVVEVTTRARPQRASRRPTTFVISDSESEKANDDDSEFENVDASDDSDFDVDD